LLIESVLEPSKQIVEGYRQSAVALSDGRVLSGIVHGESADRLTLIDVEGARHEIRTVAIDERKSVETSLMPEGLASGLTREQFADLIAYLESLRSSAPPSPGSALSGPVSLSPGFSRVRIAEGLTGTTALEVVPDGRVL